ncbi:MAG: helix-turn-helix transcriptional regulator [Bacteroidota bacterium]
MAGHLGPNLKFLRRLKGLSQQKLADIVQLKRNNIASYESGVVEPKAIVFLRLAAYFQVHPVAMFTQDLSLTPLDQLQVKEQTAASSPEIILNELEAFIKETSDMQKLVDGFQELKKFKIANQQPSNYPEDLIDILSHLLSVNWNLIHSVQEMSNSTSDESNGINK